MNPEAIVTELLSRRLGLSSKLLGAGVVERALDAVVAGARREDRQSIAARLLDEQSEEWQRLVDEVIVPETWFFRHSESFRFLASYATVKWRPANLTRTFQALCIPCASGEEPYSVVMTLLDAGLEARQIRVDAADISERMLARARLAVYGKTSFREKFGRFREEYFVDCEAGWRVREEVARLVRFEKANLLDLSRFHQRCPYNAIFCRNALIYLDERARHLVVGQLRELQDEDGLLFPGPSELTHFCDSGYVPLDCASFACRKGEAIRDRAPVFLPNVSVVTAARHRGAKKRELPRPVARPPVATCPAHEQPPSLEQAQQLADRGDLDAAAAVCKRLLGADARNPEIYALLGVISESAGDVESAEELFRKALYLAPDHYEALLHMSLLCERRGDVEGCRLYRARAGRALKQHEGKQVLKGV